MGLELTGFINHIREEHLVAEGQRVLLAVSGGRDSVTLLDLMSRAGIGVGVAHCNFHLRPGDCDRDEAFVRQLCRDHKVACHVAQFDTKAYATSHGLSVEEAARDLRYAFFEETRRKEGYDIIATAHHRDDSIETFFINLLRGTGIGGLHGIPRRNGVIVRPLLPYGRNEIDEYVVSRGLKYVEDFTNAQPLYMRNRIRLELVPLLRRLSNRFDATMYENMCRLAETDIVYKEAIDRYREHLTVKEGDKTIVDIPSLLKCEPLQTILFEILRPYGFNAAVVSQVAQSLEGQSGACFHSSTHRLVRDRNRLIITNRMEDLGGEYHIDRDCDTTALPVPISMIVSSVEGGSLRLDRNMACFDYDKLLFPLVLRRWRKGDRFRPFGMKGTRLVSDLFSDLKLSVDEKERVWLLCNGDTEGTILWVVGLRASHYAVVGSKTRKMVKFTQAID